MTPGRHREQQIATWRRLVRLALVPVIGALALGLSPASHADNIEVELRPLASQDPNDVQLWEVCFRSDVVLHRLTVGALKPTGYVGTMDWVECSATTGNCSPTGIFGSTYTNIETALSFAETVSAGTDTLFLVLAGNQGAVDGSLATSINDWVCLARLQFDPGLDVDPLPPASANLPMLASISDPNAYTLDYAGRISSGCTEPAIADDGISLAACDANGTGSGLTSLASVESVASAIPEDEDGDLRRDFEDNCIYTANADQLDQGGFQSEDEDFVGDACQCGEGEGNGVVDEGGIGLNSDLSAMLLYLQGDPSLDFDEGRCSLQNPSTCTIHDAALLDRAVKDAGALANACTAFTN